MCHQPQLTQLDYNAIFMYFQNNTKAFIAAKFTEEEDYQYMHKLARNAGGMEKKRRKELVEYCDRRQAEKNSRKVAREQKEQETAAHLAQLELILEKAKIPDLKGKALTDQLKLFKKSGAPNLQISCQPTCVNGIRQALLDAINLYENGSWSLFDNEEEDKQEESDSEEDLSDEDWE